MNFFYKHRSWMIAVVALMLFTMVVYVITNSESDVPGQPPGSAETMPADAP